MAEDGTARRKDAHLDLCAAGDVEPSENRTLLDCVRLVHCPMPEMAVSDVAPSTELFGKRLKHPLMVTGMTGGTDRAEAVNRDLAALAERYGLAFGVGSQRAMAEDASRAQSFQVRSVAPSVLLLGNVGLQQVASLGLDRVRRLKDAIDADAMALHLNVGQELTQPEGDRDFRGGYAAVEAIVKALGGKVLIKETGCGLSPQVARRLAEMGVEAMDVSGLGGTSWVRVEQLRADGVAARVGAEFSAWGIPTAAAVASVRRAVGQRVRLVASGGVRSGLEVAKCLALGADLAGMALPLFRAQQRGGLEAAALALQEVLLGLTHAMVLTGSRTPTELRNAPRVVVGELKDWLQAL